MTKLYIMSHLPNHLVVASWSLMIGKESLSTRSCFSQWNVQAWNSKKGNCISRYAHHSVRHNQCQQLEKPGHNFCLFPGPIIKPNFTNMWSLLVHIGNTRRQLWQELLLIYLYSATRLMKLTPARGEWLILFRNNKMSFHRIAKGRLIWCFLWRPKQLWPLVTKQYDLMYTKAKEFALTELIPWWIFQALGHHKYNWYSRHGCSHPREQ